MPDEDLPQQIEQEQTQLDTNVAALAAELPVEEAGPSVPLPPDPITQSVLDHEVAMRSLYEQGLLTDNHLANLSLRS